MTLAAGSRLGPYEVIAPSGGRHGRGLLHGFEEAGEVCALVMELVQGDDLVFNFFDELKRLAPRGFSEQDPGAAADQLLQAIRMRTAVNA